MNLREIYLEIHPEEIAYVNAIFESYEGVGVVRTMDRKKALVVVLVVDDFSSTARAILSSLEKEIYLKEVPRPAEIGEDWLLQELKVQGLKSSRA